MKIILFNLLGRMKGLAVAVLGIAVATQIAVGVAVAAEPYPTKPIKLIVPYGAGGATDLAARVLSSVIPEFLNQAVIVVNVTGAGGSVGFNKVRESKPDGYTMMMTAIGANVLRPAMTPKLPYQYSDLTYIARTQINPNVLIVKADSPFKDFAAFSEYVKKNSGKLKYGTAGAGNVTHLGPSILFNELGLPNSVATAVHYDSDAAAMLAMLQGEVDFVQGNLASFSGVLNGGTVRGLAMTTKERVKGFDKIPTYGELGYPGVSIVGWRGIAGPPGLPAHIAKVWEDAVAKTTQSKSWLKLVKKLGDVAGYQNTTEYNAFVGADFKRYRKLFTELGLLQK